ncbi:hypothetical protein STCU_00213 [Strigomonas culicis]|uniref:J domain-containing protein n=1 Tax=Strigomonas culicis TaxID=28005 RepID=S9VE62_9TRYP|nr:hypothetical protein STCU_08566 [Strigomonas culicis]EPY28908.1 hypothetical protein STCU_04821 [Strigomonas culicis]EPY37084.1 hypothetical protein STCU_00213 [Strigomonas culicis]|eukprot:EPY21395.1 hypothetical protein STCU_08566 [Strigomonas culicis]
MKPLAAQMRQQQSQSRRSKIEESAAKAQQALGNTNMTSAQARQLQYAMASRAVKRDPTKGLITQAEWDEIVGSHEDSGKGFRYFLGFAVLASLLLLFIGKYDEEYNVEVPQYESGKGFGELSGLANGEDGFSVGSLSAEELKKFYDILGVDEEMKSSDNTTGDAETNRTVSNETSPPAQRRSEDLDKERRRDNYRRRKAAERAYKHHQEEQGQLVACGRSCQSDHMQLELAYNSLVSQVDRELFKVLLDAKDTKSVRSTTPQLLRKKYEDKKKEILETEKDQEDRQMALEELKDAYDIIQDPDARKYYLLYGRKPPPSMRYIDARHGGWGQEMALGTYKARLILMWLDYLHTYLGLWGETVIILCFIGFFCSRLPNSLKQTMRVLDDMEWQEQGAAEGKPKPSE